MANIADVNDCIALYLKGEQPEDNPSPVNNKVAITLKLEHRVPITPTAYIFVFSYLPESQEHFKCNTFAHFLLHGTHPEPSVEGYWNGDRLQLEGNKVAKKFTPIFIDQAKRQVHFLIRIYRCTERFPDGGRFTRFLEKVKLNDELVANPFISLSLLIEPGVIRSLNTNYSFETLNIIAGGTGITPYIRFLLHNTTSKVKLLFCNKTLKELLLKPLFDKIKKQGLLEVRYLVTSEDPDVVASYQPKEGDNIVFGKLSREHAEGFFDKHQSYSMICGPPGMKIKATEILTELDLL